MIGQRTQGTLWLVVWTYKAVQQGDQAEHFVQAQKYVITADPAGGDLLEVSRLVALGAKPELAQDFVIQQCNRIGEVSGLGIAVGSDRGWPTGLDVGAVVLEAGSRQFATIGDLRHELMLAQAEVTRLEVELQELKRQRAEEPRP